MKKIIIAAITFLLASQLAVAETTSDPISVFDSGIYSDLFSTDEMRAIFSDRAMVQQWLRVETALAKTQAKLGIIPQSAASAIATAATIDNIDFDRLRRDTGKVGRGIAPLLKQIKAHGDKQVAEYLHWGSTTQDVMDTATVLQITAATELINTELTTLTLQIADLAEQHKNTVMLARTNGQDALPTTFGLHLTTYMMELYRHIQRLDESSSRLTIQLGGTVGNLSAFAEKGLEMQELMARELGLASPVAPWNPSRDNFAQIVQTLALINTTLGRIAADINNLGRTQIDEIREGEGGSSSTMPHKVNPRASEFIGGLARMSKAHHAAALDIMSHTDTRQGAPWILEWSIIPESFMVTATAIKRAQDMFTHLIIKPENMLKNFNDSNYFVMAEAVMYELAKQTGRASAYKTLKEAIQKAPLGTTLKELIANNPDLNQHLKKDQIDDLLLPQNYLGSSAGIVERSVKKIRDTLYKKK